MNTLPTLPSVPADALLRLDTLLASGQRKLLGLIGAPGSGKSTLAAALLQAVGTDRAQVVPMDGFHLANVELQRLGRAGRKGAPDSGAIAVLPSTQLVITEGNYLLHDVGPWTGAARLLDETWYVDIDDAVREQRLVSRHRQFGRSA